MGNRKDTTGPAVVGFSKSEMPGFSFFQLGWNLTNGKTLAAIVFDVFDVLFGLVGLGLGLPLMRKGGWAVQAPG